MKLYEYTISELSDMLKNGKCSAAEILCDVKGRIDSIENKIGAYITLNENALEVAKNADRLLAEGKPLHPLAGIPIALKDNISTKGMRTTCASKMLEGYIPPYNALAADRLEKCGAVIIGKTNMDEFAMGSSTESSYFGVTRNPHNTEFVPGGSSGGSAAAVCAGEAIAALGSDTGGSVRQPASFCGMVGIKPTYGRVSRYGLIAYASSFDQIGAITKSVRDSALLLGAVSGHDLRDSTSLTCECPDFSALLTDNIKGLRIGIAEEYFSGTADSEIKDIVLAAVKELEKAGAVPVSVSLPAKEYAVSTYYTIACAEASSNLARYDGVRYGYRAEGYRGTDDMFVKSRSEGFGREVKRRIMLGTFVLTSGYADEYYRKAKLMQARITREFSEAFEKCDVIALPTAPTAAFRIDESSDDIVKLYGGDICTVPANITGLPAISVPCGRTSSGLPVGLQLMGRHCDEQTLFNTAYSYENIVGGFREFACTSGEVLI